MTLPLALTMGEPAGIGGEIALKAWLRRSEGVPAFYLIDDPDRLARLARSLDWDVKIQAIDKRERAISLFADALPVAPLGAAPDAVAGKPQPADAKLVVSAIDTAVADVR